MSYSSASLNVKDLSSSIWFLINQQQQPYQAHWALSHTAYKSMPLNRTDTNKKQ